MKLTIKCGERDEITINNMQVYEREPDTAIVLVYGSGFDYKIKVVTEPVNYGNYTYMRA
jgi:hypothetical protein